MNDTGAGGKYAALDLSVFHCLAQMFLPEAGLTASGVHLNMSNSYQP